MADVAETSPIYVSTPAVEESRGNIYMRRNEIGKQSNWNPLIPTPLVTADILAVDTLTG